MSRTKKMHPPLELSFDKALGSIANQNKPPETSYTVRPFLKWVGGKRSILDELSKRVPSEYKAYVEPFLGGGALYFSLKPEKAYLSDINFHLVLTYQAVRDDVDELIKCLKIHQSRHEKKYFLNARDRLFTEKESTKIASLFIYLNKTCFNGLYRVNKAGKFNVPMGDYKDPQIFDEENLRLASGALKGVEIEQHDFSQVELVKGNFYYLDPPYHETYASYDGSGFKDDEHIALANFCKEIHKAGGYFMLSNSDTDLIRTIYKSFKIEVISASRSVSCKGNQRGKEKELLIRNY